MLNGTAIGTTNTAAEVTNKITPGDISDPQEVIARGEALSFELGTPITTDDVLDARLALARFEGDFASLLR